MSVNNNNRRELYRCEPAPVWAPILSVLHQGQRIAADRVIDVNLRGVRVSFATTRLATLPVGEVITASIQAPGLDGCADLGGRVVFSETRGAELVVAIAFDAAPDLGDRVTADFFSVFNRRNARRQSPAPGADNVSALVLNAAGEPDGVIDLKLRDHSDSSVGFVVDEDTDAFLREGAAVALPTPDGPHTVRPAVVRRREAQDDSVYYGCSFDDPAPAGA